MTVNVGIEYELEGVQVDLGDLVLDGWIVEEDSTLRNCGYEFVLDGPRPIPEAKRLVSSLLGELDDMYEVSHRCSTHIHIDTRELNYYARLSLLFGLIIHDDVFFKEGVNRRYNNFCCPVLYSPAAVIAINHTMKAPVYVDGSMTTKRGTSIIPLLCDSDHKYLSVNTMPLGAYSPMGAKGSIELRHFDPLVVPGKMDMVLDTIEAIYTVASAVPANGKDSCIEVWRRATQYDPVLSNATQWVEGMYRLHNAMAGVK